MSKNGREKNGKWEKGRQMPQEEKDKIAEALKGNTNKLKLKTEEIQKTAYLAYCNWIATGRGKQGFVFDYETEDGQQGFVTWQTLENYIKAQRFDLDPSYKEKAENLSYQVWENTGIEMMQGKVDKCQPVIFQMMMRNKFGWDKESKVTHTHETDARKFMKFCEESETPPKSG